MSHLNQGWWESGGERRQSAEAALAGKGQGPQNGLMALDRPQAQRLQWKSINSGKSHRGKARGQRPKGPQGRKRGHATVTRPGVTMLTRDDAMLPH